MRACTQTKDVNILQHGIQVSRWFWKFYNLLEGTVIPEEHTEPPWLHLYKEEILAELQRFDRKQISDYQIYHDCGKPYCKEGEHFLNHAKVSYETWLSFSDDQLIANWILHDMDAHLIKAKDIPDFVKIEGCIVLLVTALAELHANAEMFGGLDSTSFKIKFKQIRRRGAGICKAFFGEK